MDDNLVTNTQIKNDLKKLGLSKGMSVMLHVSVKAIGHIVGGPDVALDAILEVLEKEGTLMMLIGSEDSPLEIPMMLLGKREFYFENLPPFEVNTTRAYRKWSILTEYLRTRNGAIRSTHPDSSFAAIGSKSKWLCHQHPINNNYGINSPLERLYQGGGKILNIGAPLETTTILHYAEHLAQIENKRRLFYKAKIKEGDQISIVNVEDLDTCNGIIDYPENYFKTILKCFIENNHISKGYVGNAQSYLFETKELVDFGKYWMEKNL